MQKCFLHIVIYADCPVKGRVLLVGEFNETFYHVMPIFLIFIIIVIINNIICNVL